jgi:cell wall assembly regulator SMI1
MPGLTPKDIAALEQELGCTLPVDVRAKYSESDGMFGPTNCRLLYPYRSTDGNDVVRINSVVKTQPAFPQFVAHIAILGDDGCGNLLCFDPEQSCAILWHPADGDCVQARFPTMTDLWAEVVRQYDSVA